MRIGVRKNNTPSIAYGNLFYPAGRQGEGDMKGKILGGTANWGKGSSEANSIVGGQVKGEIGINEGQDRTKGNALSFYNITIM